MKTSAPMLFEQQSMRSRKPHEQCATFSSGAADSVSIFASCGGIEVRSDRMRLEAIDAQDRPIITRIVIARPGGHVSSPDRPPGRNFDLLRLCLAMPPTSFGPRHELQIG